MRAAAGATSRERARARARLETAHRRAVFILFDTLVVRDRDVAAVPAALKLEVARRQRMLVVHSGDLSVDGE